MCCHSRLSLTTSALFQTFILIDRYTSKFIVKNSNYQLLALACLWISSKFFDQKKNIPNLITLQNLCCNQFNALQFKEMEFNILKSLNWSILTGSSNTNYTPDILIDTLLFDKAIKQQNTFNINC